MRICLDNEKLFHKSDFLNILYKIEKLLEIDNTDYNEIGQELVRAIMKIPNKNRYTEVSEIADKFKIS